ncbi:hypothetical protein BJY24_007675 [Nocardia transvalensis]|uniref:Uncharacterized protein n=1 Tax=Nocardia transvalensis TaxID=37333 RepID=A0A7W9PNA4_9NOCA|nr:hypothetical protein [Nocardia transvalensis]MBB5918763.1 hypothetical protein [Nocardia transvalensis]
MSRLAEASAEPILVEAPVVGAYLLELAERLGVTVDPATIHAVFDRACGGQLNPRGPDGRRASTLNGSGLPLDVNVTGGLGEVMPVIRYVTQSGTEHREFGPRVAAQLAVIRDLAGWLPHGSRASADLLQNFVETLFPDPDKVAVGERFATWTGVVHHAAMPHHLARLKVYGNLSAVPGALRRLCDAWPGFAGLIPEFDSRRLIKPVFAALEVDASGDLNHKIYLDTRTGDAAVPTTLVRYFGEPVREALAEFARCGVDPDEIHKTKIIVCCASSVQTSSVTTYIGHARHLGTIEMARELSIRHHGTTRAVDALTRAAESCGAMWRRSYVALGFSAERGLDKLNVYGPPVWTQCVQPSATGVSEIVRPVRAGPHR